MSRKPKFKPEITRVKLNPEQAVLSCTCYNAGWTVAPSAYYIAYGADSMLACTGGKSISSWPTNSYYNAYGGHSVLQGSAVIS